MVMTNIRSVSIEEDPDLWPSSLDDLRRNPGRPVTLADLARLGLVRSYDGTKRFPPPLNTPSDRRMWEGRVILRHIGADLDLPDDDKAKADPPAAAKEAIEPPD
jgi:hypothetical protein